MMMRRLITAAAAAALAVVGLAAPAAAHDGWHAVEPWRPVDTAGAANGYEQTDSAHSHIPFSHSAEATWVDGEAASAGGTSIETPNLGLAVETGDVVEVEYELLDGADPTSGAARLFIYLRPHADTVSERPDELVAVPNDALPSGKISLTVPEDGTIGTAGVVYDTSNGGVEGTVRFADLTVDDELVSFLPTPEIKAQKPTVEQYECSDDKYVADLVIPEQEGVEYDAASGPVEAGDLTVTASAAEGYKLKGETKWTLPVDPVDECTDPEPDPDPDPDPGKDPGTDPMADPNDDDSKDDDDKHGKVTEDDDDTKPVASSLPDTGAGSNVGLIALVGGLVLALGVSALVFRRHLPLPGGRFRA